MRYAIALLLSCAASFTWAQDLIRSLPSGASQILVRGETYYYSAGSFYRLVRGGYSRVEPPLGARVPYAPGSSRTFTMGGDRYFVTRSGAFLRYEPSGDDFAVVPPPYGWRDYDRGAPGLRSLPAPQAAPRAVPQAPIVSRAYPRLSPGFRAGGGYYAEYRGTYPAGPGGGYYGRYGFRDYIGDQSYRERRATCRRIASDQSRRGDVGPYRREPGSYRDEFERCMR
ncbi:DUF6515 family protein [Microbulbifer guangxiensis]|uniref:DUF6515 family protein n=1 Tax=Microbulbifer guangxiensis TaxID=2904249 RepID=UPI001F1C758B|nr:DUF6515 family protein [Microbulbifer guangxiensis]